VGFGVGAEVKKGNGLGFKDIGAGGAGESALSTEKNMGDSGSSGNCNGGGGDGVPAGR